MSRLRPFQRDLKNEVYNQWDQGKRGVVMQSSTGSGKTVIIGEIANDHARAPWNPRLPGGVAIAHRGELVSQISQAFAREGVSHGIIGAPALIKNIVSNHVEELGHTLYNARAAWKVASVDTLIKRRDMETERWLATVGQVMVDEGHHVLRSNKWGKACLMAHPDARILLPTATPGRADGKGLGSHAEGLADAMVEGPPMRWLIESGYLTDYRYFGVNPSDLNLDGVDVSSTTGDFNYEQLRVAVKKSTAIVGDIVSTYVKFAMGKLGVTFAVDIEHGQQITDAFNAAGVPAALVTSDSTEAERHRALRDFKARKLLQLVNVDLFGEGYDLPAIECVSFGRPTASFALYTQQWGRALRLMISEILQATWGDFTDDQRLKFIGESMKPVAYVFDHAANLIRHNGPPDKSQIWTLDSRVRGSRAADSIPYRTCLGLMCFRAYERIYDVCPYCNTPAPAPADRSGANMVDGDVFEYTPEALAKARGEVGRIDASARVPAGVPAAPVIRNHVERQKQQHYLRQAIALWAGSYGDDPDRVNYRRFYFTFKIDVLSALALGAADAIELTKKVNDDLQKRAIVINVTQPQQELTT